MINAAYNNGCTAALARFKVAQGMGVVGGSPANATIGGQAAAASSRAPSLPAPVAGAAPTSAAPPVAAGANKVRALG